MLINLIYGWNGVGIDNADSLELDWQNGQCLAGLILFGNAWLGAYTHDNPGRQSLGRGMDPGFEAASAATAVTTRPA